MTVVDQPRVYVRIQHVAARDADPVFQRLTEQLSPYPFLVVTDDGGPGNRTWLTYRRCLEHVPYTATHVLVLQDDVTVSTNFLAAVKRIAASRPDDIVALFLGNKPTSSVISYFRACDADERYARLDNRTWIPAQALVWPRFMIPPMLRYADVYYRDGRPDDELIGQFCGYNGIEPIATIPTLVQHEGAFGGDSTVGAGGGSYRRAVCHVGGYDPLEIGW